MTTQMHRTAAAPAAPTLPQGRHGLRVLEVCGVHDGGAAQHVLDLSAGLADRGWSVHLCCPPGWLPDAAGDVVDEVHIAPFVRQPNPVADARVLRTVAGLIRRLRPDLIHAHSSKAGVLARTAARRHGTPAVFTPHAWSFLAASTDAERAVWTRTERMMAGSGRGIVCVSEHERRLGIEAGVLTHTGGVVIPNAVRMPEEEPSPQRVAPVIGTLARLSRQKGLDVLLDAMALLVRERPDARLSIAGGGPLEVELRMHARRLGLDGHVRFEGWVPDGRALLADWDVFVLPSRWEGMPLALLEARAAGLPSVATDVGGAREIIRDGEDGWVVPTEDPASLAAALLDLADDPARRAEWGARARRRAAGEHGLDEMVRRTELHYLEQVVFAERHA